MRLEEARCVLRHLPIRVGNWKGAGIVLAWEKNGSYYFHRYWPDRADIEDALQAINDDLIGLIEAAIPEDDE